MFQAEGRTGVEFVKLNNGVLMPQVSFGTYQIPLHRTRRCVEEALACGYRGIDTAQNYGNEREVGEAIARSGIDRSEVFVTTKTQTSGYARTAEGIDRSLRELGCDYVDLLIIHWPSGDVCDTYRALEDAYRAGKARAIGVSNFYGDDLARILRECSVVPAVDQIECHPFWQQQVMRDVLSERGIRLMDWSPLAEGSYGIFGNTTLTAIGDRHGKRAAQVALRFLVQRGDILAVKSMHRDRMLEDIDVFDFELDADEVEAIEALDIGHGFTGWPSSGRIAEYTPSKAEQF